MPTAYDILRKVPKGRECCGSSLTLEDAQETLAELKKATPGQLHHQLSRNPVWLRRLNSLTKRLTIRQVKPNICLEITNEMPRSNSSGNRR